MRLVKHTPGCTCEDVLKEGELRKIFPECKQRHLLDWGSGEIKLGKERERKASQLLCCELFSSATMDRSFHNCEPEQMVPPKV